MISQNIGVSVLPENAVMIPTYDNLCFVPIEGFTKTRELGARRRFKTRIGLLAQPNFTPPISGAKVLADISISASTA
jgi:hypothetical protein